MVAPPKLCGKKTNGFPSSFEWVVRAAVKHLGFPVNQQDIFGIRVQLDGDPLTTKLASKYPVHLSHRES